MKQKAKMKDGLMKRGRNSWAIVVNKGFTTDATGTRRQKQEWVSFKGTYEEAKQKRDELRDSVRKKTFISPSKLAVRDALADWLETDIAPPKRTGNTYRGFKRLMERHVYSRIGDLRLQELEATDLKRAYAEMTYLSRRTVELIHDIIHSWLEQAVANKQVQTNVASVRGVRPLMPKQQKRGAEHILRRCWTIDEAQRALAAAKQEGGQTAALMGLALDSGLRQGELLGLKWPDIDLDAGKVTVMRQLLNDRPDADPDIASNDPKRWRLAMFGPPKGGEGRVVDISDETVALLRQHQLKQLRHLRLNLVFTDVRRGWRGRPLRKGAAVRILMRVAKAANVRVIPFHGLRHTSASLQFANGESVPVVQHRLGHTTAQVTTQIYFHLLPTVGKAAAQRLAKLLHG